MGLKFKKFMVATALLIVSLAFLTGNGLEILFRELIFGNLLTKMGIIFLSFWLLAWFVFHIFYLVVKREIKSFIFIFCFLFWLGISFLFPVVRNMLNGNLSLQVFWLSIVFFDGFWLFIDTLEALKETEEINNKAVL